MYSLVMASWLCLPLAPLNPLEQDTLPVMSFHLTAGITAPTDISSSGPELTAKYEMLATHPVVVRGTVEYRFSHIRANVYPQRDSRYVRLRGDLHGFTAGADVLYYRGTNRLTGYLGLGAVYSLHSLITDEAASASMARTFDIDKIEIAPAVGYRVTMGLRYHRVYSLEITITELRPKFLYTRYMDTGYARSDDPTRLSGFRVSVGHLWTIRQW
ncbi:MAG: hypothetical protein AB1644_10370 [Candidatus Zixiibacteriota bacterium]